VLVGVLLGGNQLGWIGFVGALMIIGGIYFGLGIEGEHRRKATPPAEF
jgi:hypothetical protein